MSENIHRFLELIEMNEELRLNKELVVSLKKEMEDLYDDITVLKNQVAYLLRAQEEVADFYVDMTMLKDRVAYLVRSRNYTEENILEIWDDRPIDR